MSSQSEIINHNLSFRNRKDLQLTCDSITNVKALLLTSNERWALGSTVEVSLNTNELMGDDTDDVVLTGICVEKRSANQYQVIFPELPPVELFQKRFQENTKVGKFVAPESWSKKRRQQKGLKQQLSAWKKAASQHRLAVGLFTTGLVFLILVKIVWQQLSYSSEFMVYPPSWEKTVAASGITNYEHVSLLDHQQL